jgi:putative PIN family toxin of toxin-antitoxin system
MRRPRLVIDTNIFIPGLIGAVAVPPRTSASTRLLRAWRGDRCTLVLSEALLDEYWRVLQRPPFNITSSRASRLRDAIRDRALMVDPDLSRPILQRDPDDNIALLTAVAGHAEMLVTDNIADFQELAKGAGKRAALRHRGVRIVQLSECLTTIRAMHHDADAIMRRKSPW